MPRKFRDRVRLIGGYFAGQTRDVPGPSALMLETTVRCNLLCPMCPRTGAGYPNADMPDELLYGAIDDFAALGGDHVYLYGLGEPFMDPRIFTILRHCKAHDLGTVLSTNATFLDAERRAALLDAECDHLLVGIDGASPETYAFYRTGGKYERVVEQVKALAREKVERGSRLYLVVQFIRMAQNWHEQDLFMEKWKGVEGIDDVRIKDEDIGLPDHRTYLQDGEERRNPCHTLWRGPMVVRYTGEVFACYHKAEHGSPIGNLAETSLRDLWESDTLVELRSLHVRRAAGEDAQCKTCPSVRPRAPFVLGAMALRGTTVRRLVPMAEKLATRFPSIVNEARKRPDDAEDWGTS